jgi:hypothetical protein
MKKIITIALLLVSFLSNAQFEGSWYTFRIEDISFTTITKDQLITGRIGKYNSEKEYTANVDTLQIKKRIVKNDSILYLLTSSKYDHSKKLMLHKFAYHKNSNTISTFFYDTLKKFMDMYSKDEKMEIKDIEKLISDDHSNVSYLTYYRKEAIATFISYPRLIEQPADKIIQLYDNLSLIYLALQSKTKEEMFPYFLLKGLSKSTLEVPAYLELKINPMVSPEDFDEILIEEKFNNNSDVIHALEQFQKSKRQLSNTKILPKK